MANSTALDGLWILLVNNDGRLPTDGIDGRVPIMCKAGNDEHFVLGFKDMSKAQQFLTQSELQGAEPRMVVKSNHGDYIRVAQEAGAAGVLIDYDPTTQQYRDAAVI